VDVVELQSRLVDQSPESVGAMFLQRVAKTPDSTAFTYPDADEQWQTLTWRDVDDLVSAVAAALLLRGLEAEDRIAIASITRIEWILACFGIGLAGGAITTIYPNTAAEDVGWILSDSGARLVFAENADQVAKIRAHRDLDAAIATIVVFDGQGDGDGIVAWDDFLAQGRAHLGENPDCVARALAQITKDSLAALIYTSGTTGRPKGVRLNHLAWTYLATSVDVLDLAGEDDLQFLWLPLSHVFGLGITYCQLQLGFATAVDGRIDRIIDNLGVVKPTFMAGAPRIFEKVRAAMLTGDSSRGLKGRIARWAFATGYKTVDYRLAERPLPKGLAARFALADKLVFSKLRAKMGGNIRFMVSGSAKLSPQVQRWLYAAGITLIEGYGCTESGAISFVNHHRHPVLGSLGPAIPGLETMIAADGEILLRGPTIMTGYHNNPEATAEAIDADGWLHTGDIGHLDDQEYLVITDRKKDLLKTSGGKYVAPAKVEGAITANVPYVSQAVVVGDGHKYIGALVVLDPGALMRWGRNHGHADLSYAELSQLPAIRRSIDRFMARANRRLEHWETVKRYAILDHELTVEDGDVTASLKVRRSVVIKAHQAIVDSLFEGES